MKDLWSRHILRIIVVFFFTLNLFCLSTPDEEEPSDGIVPHPAEWEKAGNHGQQFLVEEGSCATSCHGQDLEGGFTSISCTQCHESYPHPAAWILPSAHGGPVFEAGTPAGCATSCHGTDFQGGLSLVSCFTCHQDYPHGESWADFERHGAVAKPEASRNCASFCHGRSFEGGDSGLSCFDCHGAYPHIDWSPFSEHISWVNTFGDTSCLTAQGCHDDFRGPDFGQPFGCTSLCHRPNPG